MVRSEAKTPEAYLSELPADRAAVVAAVRELVSDHIPPGYEETMEWGMISWQVPLERYPDTYNGKPLGYVALAAQKNHYALYLHGLYMQEEERQAFLKRWKESGKRVDMGKSCVRFRALDDLPREEVARAVASLTVDDFLRVYESVRRR